MDVTQLHDAHEKLLEALALKQELFTALHGLVDPVSEAGSGTLCVSMPALAPTEAAWALTQQPAVAHAASCPNHHGAARTRATKITATW